MSWRGTSCSDGRFGPHLCLQQGCVAPHPHQEANTGVPRVKVAAAEDSSPSLKGAGGRGSRSILVAWFTTITGASSAVVILQSIKAGGGVVWE